MATAGEKSFPFDSEEVNGEYDRGYLAEDFTRYFRAFISSGVFMKASSNLQVIANGDMTVMLKTGALMIEGYRYDTVNDNNLSTYKRIGIYWAVYSTNFATMYTEIPIYSFNSIGSVLSFYGENHHWRHLRINENDIVFSDGKINTSTETRSVVPMKIIGIK